MLRPPLKTFSEPAGNFPEKFFHSTEFFRFCIKTGCGCIVSGCPDTVPEVVNCPGWRPGNLSEESPFRISRSPEPHPAKTQCTKNPYRSRLYQNCLVHPDRRDNVSPEAGNPAGTILHSPAGNDAAVFGSVPAPGSGRPYAPGHRPGRNKGGRGYLPPTRNFSERPDSPYPHGGRSPGDPPRPLSGSDPPSRFQVSPGQSGHAGFPGKLRPENCNLLIFEEGGLPETPPPLFFNSDQTPPPQGGGG